MRLFILILIEFFTEAISLIYTGIKVESVLK